MMNKQDRRLAADDDDDDDDDDAFDERGLLKDGRTYRVPLRFADSQQRQVAAHAAAVNASLHQPGFRMSDTAGRSAKQRAYDLYDADLVEAYKNPPTGFGSSEFAGQREGDLCTINGAAGHLQRRSDGSLVCVPDRPQNARTATNARENAYVEYERWVSNAWRG